MQAYIKVFSAITCWALIVMPLSVGAVVPMPLTCSAVEPLPDSVMREGDREAERAFCDIDTTNTDTAVCPKIWSTSPAALIYALDGTEWAGRADDFERSVCPRGRHAIDDSRVELAVFKNSLNGQYTSGTYAPASLLYYHFSRYLDTRLDVPVAVRAEFPVSAYRERVIKRGLALSGSAKLKMLHAGWTEMDQATANPTEYSHRSSLFDREGENLWGVFLLFSGKRYGPEVNGTRESGWGVGQNRDFQRTAPFLALRQNLPLGEAIAKGLDAAHRDPKMQRALSDGASPSQIALWMAEITEIVILDYILRQQDRIGNIDYNRHWMTEQDGRLVFSDSQPSAAAVRVHHTVLNDNDAGVYGAYANFAQKAGMLDDWHHMDPGLYQRLQQLATDFAAGGDVAAAVLNHYGITTREANGILLRAQEVAKVLRDRCRNGELRFDLDAAGIMDPAAAQAVTVECSVAPASGGANPQEGVDQPTQ